MLQFDEYKVKLNNLLPQLDDLEQALNLDEAARQVDFLEAQCAADGFWDNPENSQKVLQKLKQEKNKLESQAKRRSSWDDMMVLCEMGNEEEDESLLPELEEEYATLIQSMESARLQTLLTGEYDASNAILAFHAGAGGTEAQDWAQMLYRMYTRWAERHGFTYKIMDYQEGDEAGLKSATIMIEGENAYGYLRGEHGVHRLVRVSPFDANARRQTSFASVEVMPDLPEDADIEIRPEDIEMQVYRSSGAGGQHINKTSSAVRLIHKPSGIVVACQEERSQVQNREKCMQMLASKLYQIEQARIESAVTSERRSQVGTGMRNERIRTYNFPQGRVTDHRIGLTLYKIDSIMDGALDELIDALVTADQAEKLQSSKDM